MLINVEQLRKKKYLETGGEYCPFCNSRNIMTLGNLEADCGGADQEVECHDCGKIWLDVYELVDVDLER